MNVNFGILILSILVFSSCNSKKITLKDFDVSIVSEKQINEIESRISDIDSIVKIQDSQRKSVVKCDAYRWSKVFDISDYTLEKVFENYSYVIICIYRSGIIRAYKPFTKKAHTVYFINKQTGEILFDLDLRPTFFKTFIIDNTWYIYYYSFNQLYSYKISK